MEENPYEKYVVDLELDTREDAYRAPYFQKWLRDYKIDSEVMGKSENGTLFVRFTGPVFSIGAMIIKFWE